MSRQLFAVTAAVELSSAAWGLAHPVGRECLARKVKVAESTDICDDVKISFLEFFDMFFESFSGIFETELVGAVPPFTFGGELFVDFIVPVFPDGAVFVKTVFAVLEKTCN